MDALEHELPLFGAREHDHGELCVLAAKPGEGVEPRDVGEAEIEHDPVGRERALEQP